jgi:hypothetical protein
MIRGKTRLQPFWLYVASLSILCCGSIISAHFYPDGFDWQYTVASALASQKHNPAGSIWFAGTLILSMLLLWPYVSALRQDQPAPLTALSLFAFGALRTGLICGALLGLERLVIHDLSDWVYKAHEILGLLTFLGLYCGILCLLIQTMLRNTIYLIANLLVVSPLIAIGITQCWLYLEQRNLGWVDTSWRVMGIPVWLSFAFWQWLAIAVLWLGLGLLLFTSSKQGKSDSCR